MDPTLGTLGEVRLFAGNFAPRSWAFCEGQLLAISQNEALFSILGTTYGGDGRTTFALPDLRGRTPGCPGTGPGLSTYLLGMKRGVPTSTFTVLNLPSHTHEAQAYAGTDGISASPTNTIWSAEAGGITLTYSDATPDSNMHPQAISSVGGNQSFDIYQPYLGLHYIIALYGLYPSCG